MACEVLMVCFNLNLCAPEDWTILLKSLSDTEGFEVAGWIASLSRSQFAGEEGNGMTVVLIIKLIDDRTKLDVGSIGFNVELAIWIWIIEESVLSNHCLGCF